MENGLLLKQVRLRGGAVILPRQTSQHRLDPQLMPVAILCLNYGLSPAEGQVLAALCKYNVVTKKQLQVAISGNLATDPNIVSVILTRLRKRLRRHLPDAKITSAYNFGSQLDAASRKKTQRLLAATVPRTQEA
jgi:DNA-binding response OmpR family regulator